MRLPSTYRVAAMLVAVSIGVYLLFGPIADVQRENLQSMVEDCNAEYGSGEWVAVPANASERGWYMGQMAVCVSDDSPRSEDCDTAWVFGCDPPEAVTVPGGGA